MPIHALLAAYQHPGVKKQAVYIPPRARFQPRFLCLHTMYAFQRDCAQPFLTRHILQQNVVFEACQIGVESGPGSRTRIMPANKRAGRRKIVARIGKHSVGCFELLGQIALQNALPFPGFQRVSHLRRGGAFQRVQATPQLGAKLRQRGQFIVERVAGVLQSEPQFKGVRIDARVQLFYPAEGFRCGIIAGRVGSPRRHKQDCHHSQNRAGDQPGSDLWTKAYRLFHSGLPSYVPVRVCKNTTICRTSSSERWRQSCASLIMRTALGRLSMEPSWK